MAERGTAPAPPTILTWMRAMTKSLPMEGGLVEMLWMLTTAVSDGDWAAQTPEWREAADICRQVYLSEKRRAGMAASDMKLFDTRLCQTLPPHFCTETRGWRPNG